MYTDTKNLAHQLAELNLNTNLAPNTPTERSKQKLYKMWRPLLRLMARKCNKTKAASSAPATVTLHPNNVHLNNSTPSKSQQTSNSISSDPVDWPTTLIEDYTSLMRKMSLKDECNHGAWEASATSTTTTPEAEQPCQASAKFATTIISSASIEKTPPSTCAHCVYGRNCQHEQSHHHICDAAVTYATSTSARAATITPAGAPESITMLTQPFNAAHFELPIQFVHTDDDTFFWTNAEEKIDDDLLTAWLCESWRQAPLEAAAF
ncbi:enhancer of split M2 protein [Eurosta solidaginis]|uniref:enhancer of split M2 protein n=1 Tax=Eurosta solidaginis TaxID=178769 RepID=UPI003530CA1B